MTNATVAERFVSERAVVSVIFINTIAIFLRAFPGVSEETSLWLFAIDYVCTVYFVFELTTKIRLTTLRVFLESNWNRFDLVVVVLSTPLLLSPMLDLSDFGVVLLLRLGRLGRFFRLLRFVPDGDRLWAGVRRGLRASVGVILALALYNFALGLAACYILGPLDKVHFGDPIVAVYSMFKVFTVEGWFTIPDALAAKTDSPLVGWAIRGFFAFVVTTGGILGLSMANAVFVDEMVMDNNRELEEEMVRVSTGMDDILLELRALREENTEMAEQIASMRAHLAPGDDDA